MSYDRIWLFFRNFMKMEDVNLPTLDEEIYDCINSAILKFNNRMRTKYVCDDTSETVVGMSNEDELLVLVMFIKLIVVENEYTYYQSLMQTFAADVGIRNYNTQLNAIKFSIQKVEQDIDKYIFNSREDFL